MTRHYFGTDGIRGVVGQDESMRKQMGALARENVKRYQPEIVMAQWNELFNTVQR